MPALFLFEKNSKKSKIYVYNIQTLCYYNVVRLIQQKKEAFKMITQEELNEFVDKLKTAYRENEDKGQLPNDIMELINGIYKNDYNIDNVADNIEDINDAWYMLSSLYCIYAEKEVTQEDGYTTAVFDNGEDLKLEKLFKNYLKK